MPRSQSIFVCTSCGNESSKWMGKCMSCGEWNTYKEITDDRATLTSKSRVQAKETARLATITSKELIRIQTGIKELDKSLGGGIVKGQVLLLAGEPGIGKSTILLQIADHLKNVLYISGEESLSQIKLRTQRLDIKAESMSLMSETNIDTVLATAEKEVVSSDIQLIIIDSVQTMYTTDIASIPGSVGQVRETSLRLIRFAKRTGIPIILVGHVTKEGNVAGPATLMHMVDTVLWFEGENRNELRIIRVMKNRFGPTDEISIFMMREHGLTALDDLDEIFSADRITGVPGTVTSCVMEGSRTMLVEVQSLVLPSKLAIPRRVVQGIDAKRVELILAVLTKHAGINLSDSDVFVNVVGGMKHRDTSIDLAVAISIASSKKDKVINKNVAAIGEVGLLGDVRMPAQISKYTKHLKKHKKTVVGPDSRFIKDALKVGFSS